MAACQAWWGVKTNLWKLLSEPPKLLSQLQGANKSTETLTQAEGSSSFKVGSFVFPLRLSSVYLGCVCRVPAASWQSWGRLMDLWHMALMTYLPSPACRIPGAGGWELEKEKAAGIWAGWEKWSVEGYWWEKSADMCVEAVSPLRDKGFRDSDPVGYSGVFCLYSYEEVTWLLWASVSTIEQRGLIPFQPTGLVQYATW